MPICEGCYFLHINSDTAKHIVRDKKKLSIVIRSLVHPSIEEGQSIVVSNVQHNWTMATRTQGIVMCMYYCSTPLSLCQKNAMCFVLPGMIEVSVSWCSMSSISPYFTSHLVMTHIWSLSMFESFILSSCLILLLQ